MRPALLAALLVACSATEELPAIHGETVHEIGTGDYLEAQCPAESLPVGGGCGCGGPDGVVRQTMPNYHGMHWSCACSGHGEEDPISAVVLCVRP